MLPDKLKSIYRRFPRCNFGQFHFQLRLSIAAGAPLWPPSAPPIAATILRHWRFFPTICLSAVLKRGKMAYFLINYVVWFIDLRSVKILHLALYNINQIKAFYKFAWAIQCGLEPIKNQSGLSKDSQTHLLRIYEIVCYVTLIFFQFL